MEDYIIIEEKRRVGPLGYYYLIIPDNMAEKRGRYRVYQIPDVSHDFLGELMVELVGRNLPLGAAKKYIKKLENGEW